ncbi:5'-nucleotidase domain-containing protein 1-like [Cimex lectularius]|uniref:5'-nucleotidase n=1 Tax=Cimex lectularius TaxID=79782 RepID=A0A8I6REU9_CIMLE|nr:5'-nucleotidase domain-containing protein 1-like [Cimex lectularius]
MNRPAGIKLDEYDFFGFDLDHTICQYNLKKIVTSSFDFMTDYLDKEKQYRGFKQPLSFKDKNFLSRGLFIDTQNGNLLKTSSNGAILRASHGTRLLTKNEICKIYGTENNLESVSTMIAKKLGEDRRQSASKVFSAMDFSDLVLSLVYAKAVDKKPKTSINQVWHDVINALVSLYNESGIWNLDRKKELVHPTSSAVIDWLKQLHNIGCTALITSSPPEAANRTATIVLGPDWKNLFDFAVFNTKKPRFFISQSRFRAISQTGRWLSAEETRFDLRGEYVSGSYHMIEKALTDTLGRRPISVYFGDSPMADLIHSATDRVAIIAEARVEGKFKGIQRHADILKSSFWGSLFYEGKEPTFMGDIIMNTSFCAPDLQYFTDFPINYTHIPFWK